MNLASRDSFVRDVRRAVAGRTGFAAGKLGTSEKYWMYYEVVLARERERRKRQAYEAGLKFHCLQQSGVFPDDLAFIREFNARYVADVRTLDSVGLFRDRLDLEDGLIDHYGLSNTWIHFVDQEPDRRIPADDDNCYLPACRGKKLLLVCPFAELLVERANATVFERVWARTGKRWFEPSSVEALAFPYGYDAATQEEFGDALRLRQHIADAMAARDFDVALIAAGGLGIPLAADVKRLGKVGISLGGHLQVLFGVIGKRWRDRPEWQAAYFTDAWIDMPGRYRPKAPLAALTDDGAYW